MLRGQKPPAVPVLALGTGLVGAGVGAVCHHVSKKERKRANLAEKALQKCQAQLSEAHQRIVEADAEAVQTAQASEAQMAALRQQASGLEETVSEMRASLARSESQLAQATEESKLAVEQHSSAMRAMESELTEVKGARNTAESDKLVVEADLTSCQRQVAQLQTDKREVESEVTRLRAQVVTSDSDKMRQECEVTTLREQVAEGERTASEAESHHLSRVKALQEELATLQAALQKSDEHDEVMQADLLSAQEQLVHAQSCHSQSDIEVASLREQLDEEKCKADEVERNHMATVDALQQQVTALVAAVQQGNEHNQVMQVDLHQAQEEGSRAQVCYTDLQSEVVRLSQQVADGKVEKMRVEQGHDEAIATLEQQVSSLQDALSDSNKQAQDAQSELFESRQSSADLVSRLEAQLASQKSQATIKQQGLVDREQQGKAELARSAEQVKQLTGANAELKAQVVALSEENKRFKRQRTLLNSASTHTSWTIAAMQDAHAQQKASPAADMQLSPPSATAPSQGVSEQPAALDAPAKKAKLVDASNKSPLIKPAAPHEYKEPSVQAVLVKSPEALKPPQFAADSKRKELPTPLFLLQKASVEPLAFKIQLSRGGKLSSSVRGLLQHTADNAASLPASHSPSSSGTHPPITLIKPFMGGMPEPVSSAGSGHAASTALSLSATAADPMPRTSSGALSLPDAASDFSDQQPTTVEPLTMRGQDTTGAATQGAIAVPGQSHTSDAQAASGAESGTEAESGAEGVAEQRDSFEVQPCTSPTDSSASAAALTSCEPPFTSITTSSAEPSLPDASTQAAAHNSSAVPSKKMSSPAATSHLDPSVEDGPQPDSTLSSAAAVPAHDELSDRAVASAADAAAESERGPSSSCHQADTEDMVESSSSDRSFSESVLSSEAYSDAECDSSADSDWSSDDEFDWDAQNPSTDEQASFSLPEAASSQQLVSEQGSGQVHEAQTPAVQTADSMDLDSASDLVSSSSVMAVVPRAAQIYTNADEFALNAALRLSREEARMQKTVSGVDVDPSSWMMFAGFGGMSALQSAGVPLIGVQPMFTAVLATAYADGPVKGNLTSVQHKFPTYRTIQGDGDCFYRALIGATLEQLCTPGAQGQCNRLHNALLQQHNAVQQWQELDYGYRQNARVGFERLEVILQIIECGGISFEELIVELNSDEQADRNVMLFLRAVTAWQLHCRQQDFSIYIVGVDAYNGSDGTGRVWEMQEVIAEGTLPLGAEAEHLQISALASILPLRLKLLDLAGGCACIQTFESDHANQPGCVSAAQPHGNTIGEAEKAAMSVPWLMHQPGHYVIVYPAPGHQDSDWL